MLYAFFVHFERNRAGASQAKTGKVVCNTLPSKTSPFLVKVLKPILNSFK